MADGAHHEVVSWFSPVVAVVSAALGAFGLWLANRMLGKAAFQTAINSGFESLTNQLQEERDAIRADLLAERLSSASERAQLRGDIINLTQVIEGLKNILRDHGIPVPTKYQAPTDFMTIPASEEKK